MRFLASLLKSCDNFIFQRACIRYLSFIAQQQRKSSYSFRAGSVQLTNATVGDVLEQATTDAGDDVAFISAHQGISKTYQEFRNEVEKLASGFIANGLQRGDRIAIYSPNCYEWPLTQFAAAKAGLVLVNINPAAQPNELEYCLKKVGCKAVISFDKFKTQDGYKILNQILPNLSTSNPRKIQSKILPNLENIFMLSEENKEGTICFHELLKFGNKDSQNALSKIEKSIECDDPVTIQFTSGTTGTPKAAILNHHSIVNNALLCGNELSFHEMRHILCCQAPMFHTLGCVLSALATVLHQNTCVYPSSIFDPVASLKSIEKYKCTTSIGSPTMFVDLLKAHREHNTDISSFNHVILGGAAPSESLILDFKKTFTSACVQIGYGLTETSPCVLMAKKESGYKENISHYLLPLSYMEVKLVDKYGSTVSINTPGEICCRGHAVFLGYWDKEQTEEVIDKARWFHTGDLGVMNEEGECKIVGRVKDMVNRGGENIYCLEVENFISSHPAVLEAAAVGVPDERMGEELCCWISVKPGMSVNEEEIRNFCKGKISHYKIPRYIIFAEEFPKTLSGKVKKFEIARISKEKINL